jgi:two-component system OmpR family sensor kinase
MTASVAAAAPEAYDRILAEYLRTHSEEALYRVSLLSQGFIESGLGPEDIIALHFETLDKILEGYSFREQARANGEAQQFLLEVMIAYGVRFKEYLELKLQEGLRDAEAQAAQERERALDAERVGRQKGEILGVIAHELRTPITAARGNLDLATRSLTRGQIERLPRLLETAREALDRLSRLSADLVEASRGDLPTLRLGPHELGPILAQACVWAEATAEAGGVRLSFEDAPIAVRARCDPDAMLSVFGNLLSNAIRYTPDGGQVTVRHGTEGAWAYAEFRDTGIGMAPDVQAQIFEKFYRAPEARRVEAKGLGLGLSLVQDLTAAHGGRVEVESAGGVGSTFRVLLPVASDAEADADG